MPRHRDDRDEIADRLLAKRHRLESIRLVATPQRGRLRKPPPRLDEEQPCAATERRERFAQQHVARRDVAAPAEVEVAAFGEACATKPFEDRLVDPIEPCFGLAAHDVVGRLGCLPKQFKRDLKPRRRLRDERRSAQVVDGGVGDGRRIGARRDRVEPCANGEHPLLDPCDRLPERRVGRHERKQRAGHVRIRRAKRVDLRIDRLERREARDAVRIRHRRGRAIPEAADLRHRRVEGLLIGRPKRRDRAFGFAVEELGGQRVVA